MSRAVKFARYGGPEVLEVVSVDRPTPGPDDVLVRVVAAALNPGEISIREGAFAALWPATFPEGQGNDFAGYVEEPGSSTFAPGDQVIGFAPRAAQAELVALPQGLVIRKPPTLAWDEAACIPGVGATAWAAVEAVAPRPGETVVVSAAAGGVGVIAGQLARLRGARVIGTASGANAGLLRELGIEPVEYGEGLRDRLIALTPHGIDAFLDNFGAGYVQLAVDLGVAPERINTIADPAATRRYGVRHAAQEQTTPADWQYLAQLAAAGDFRIPIAAAYPLDEVQQAYRDVATRHGAGKRVLHIGSAGSLWR
ncbi:NADP-dependent oxidoreductase [Kribbella sp. NPDC058245]|uniref:NADP-dependent oxidoreductase n=1 Tax=Kribbella sp. NPDC058245 TaxID=3346399 RepID=UPI0036E4F7CC